eukprot:4220693-Pleurochrysis_carterae.AAC.1
MPPAVAPAPAVAQLPPVEPPLTTPHRRAEDDAWAALAQECKRVQELEQSNLHYRAQLLDSRTQHSQAAALPSTPTRYPGS